MGNEKTSSDRGLSLFGPNQGLTDASEVNDDPAQILDVLTLSEQETEPCGADIDVARFVYEAPVDATIGTDVLDRLLAEAESEVFATTAKERERHEYN